MSKKKKAAPCSVSECFAGFVFYCGAFRSGEHWQCARKVCRVHAKSLRVNLVVCPAHKDYTVEEYDQTSAEMKR